MSIKSNKESHTITWLKAQNDAGRLNKDISIQRKEVWDAEKKSNLILSLLMDIPLESLLFEEIADTSNSYNVLDGKQRTLTICQYLDEGFPLSGKIRAKRLDGVEIDGKYFSALPEEFQRRILDYELSISTLRSLNSDERAMVFFMRNQAVALTKLDLSCVMLGEDGMRQLDALCAHEFIKSKIKLTEPARRKHTDAELLLQYVLLGRESFNGLSGTAMMNLCDDIKSDEALLDVDAIRCTLDYLNQAITEKRQYLKKVQVPVVMLIASEALLSDITPEDFAAKLDAFFAELTPDSEYMAACKSGSAKKANVLLRTDILRKAILG